MDGLKPALAGFSRLLSASASKYENELAEAAAEAAGLQLSQLEQHYPDPDRFQPPGDPDPWVRYP